MKHTAHKDVKRTRLRRIHDDRKRNVHATHQVNFVRICNVVYDKLARVEVSFISVLAGRLDASQREKENAQGQTFQTTPLNTVGKGVHDRFLRI
jgi:hypothetical protein